MRRPAKEMFVSFISDIDRMQKQDGIPHTIPVAYRLSGFSLQMDIVRGVINDFLTECSKQQIDIKLIAFDA